MDEKEIRAFEERAFNAWPALQTVFLDGWILRFADGYSKRCNSANALAPAGPFEPMLPAIETAYRRRGLRPIVRVTPLSPPETDELLVAAGYEIVETTLVLTTKIAHSETADPAVSITTMLQRTWSDGYEEATDVAADVRAAHRRILENIPVPVAYATLTENGRAIAYGFAATERGAVGLFGIVTTVEARRRGAARRIVRALLDWGCDQGAAQAYLQVVAANAAAIPLYEQTGFREAYRYHYRVGTP